MPTVACPYCGAANGVPTMHNVTMVGVGRNIVVSCVSCRREFEPVPRGDLTVSNLKGHFEWVLHAARTARTALQDTDVEALKAATAVLKDVAANLPGSTPTEDVISELLASSQVQNAALSELVALMRADSARQKRFDWKTWVIMIVTVVGVIIAWKAMTEAAPITDADLDRAVERAVASASSPAARATWRPPVPAHPLGPATRPTAGPISKPAAGLSAPCPCESGRKYRHCHGA